jgi:hypothetical protein
VEEEEEPRDAPRTIDGRPLCPGPAHLLRPAAPLASGRGDSAYPQGNLPALPASNPPVFPGEGGDKFSF